MAAGRRDSRRKIPNLKALFPKVAAHTFHGGRDMISAASTLEGSGRTAGSGTGAGAAHVPPHIFTRRLGQRRQMLAVQAASCSLISLVLLVYCYAGTISIILPAGYFLSGIGLIGLFVVLSEARVNDRFQDHYLTLFQVGGHVGLQFAFVLAAPAIGFAF